jgi:ribbon-helix-helix CopG family protein
MSAEREEESRTSGGVPVTEELVDRLADEAAAGYDVAALRRRGGRRPMGVAAAEVVPVRLDPELRSALVARADADDTSVSDVIRQALRAWLHVA